MTKLTHLLFLAFSIMVISACQPETATQQAFAVTLPVDDAKVNLATIVPTVNPTRTPSATFTALPLPTETIPPSQTASSTPIPTETVPPTPLPTTETPIPSATSTDLPEITEVVEVTEEQASGTNTVEAIAPTYTDHYAFDRPISRNSVDYIDRTYAYGDTQRGRRQVHHGVEFVNPRGTPVLAAGNGTVFYAGDDSLTVFGPEPGYYGNLVVIEHSVFSPEGLPVYTLYAHLDKIDVESGQNIEIGDHVGAIGDSGIAIGPHLHFEVRLGDPYDFYATRNPDLWIFPWPTFGTLAGQLTNTTGEIIYGRSIEITPLDNPTNIRYAYSYADDAVNSSGAWGENFTYGDLPEGAYTVRVTDDGQVLFTETITIRSRQTTWLDIVLDQ